MHFVLKGEGRFDAPGGPVPMERGTILIQPPGFPENICGPGEITSETYGRENCRPLAEGVMTYTAGSEKGDLVLGCASVSATYGGGQGLFDNVREPLAIGVCDNRLCNNAFEALLEEISSPGIGTTVLMEALMKQTFVLLLRDQLHQFGVVSPMLAPLADSRVLRAVSAVIGHPGDPHTLNSLAAIAGMSRSSFSARFAQIYRRTPGDFVQEVRLNAAAKLLRTCELPIKAVAANVGYTSRSHFSRVFRAAYGIDPTSYRSSLVTQGEARTPARPEQFDRAISK